MEKKYKQSDLDKLDNYFKETEDCTYEEFCNIYNDGSPLTGNLPFVDFPEYILEIIKIDIAELLHPRFKKFLEENKALELYIEDLKEQHSKDFQYYLTQYYSSARIIDQTLNWGRTQHSHIWDQLHNKYSNL